MVVMLMFSLFCVVCDGPGYLPRMWDNDGATGGSPTLASTPQLVTLPPARPAAALRPVRGLRGSTLGALRAVRAVRAQARPPLRRAQRLHRAVQPGGQRQLCLRYLNIL